jgi:hypothetical protein
MSFHLAHKVARAARVRIADHPIHPSFIFAKGIVGRACETASGWQTALFTLAAGRWPLTTDH